MKSLTKNPIASEGGQEQHMPKLENFSGYRHESGPARPQLDYSGAIQAEVFGSGSDVPIGRRSFLKGAGASLAMFLVGTSSVRGAQSDAVRVGFIFPQQGIVAGEAAAMLAGFECCLKEKGGLSVEILRKDSGPEDQKTLEALAELLMKSQVQFLVCTPSLDGSEKILHASGDAPALIFVTNPSVRLEAGELCVPSSFRVRANTYQSAQPLAAWAIKNIGLRVFITGDDDTQGNEEADFFAYGFEKAGGAFVDRLMAAPGPGNMKLVLDAVTMSKPDLVFASFRRKSAEDFLKVYRSASPALTHPVIGPESLTAWPSFQRGAGKAAVGVRTLTTMVNPAEFTARVKKVTGKEVGDAARAAEGYEIAQIVLKASREVLQGSIGQAGLVKFVEEMELEGPRGKIRFDKNHEPILDFMVQEWALNGGAFSQKILANLGTCVSPDFGCGRVGFPKRPEKELKEEEEQGWLEHEE